MSRGKKYDQSIKEQARAMLVINNNRADVSRQLDIPESTLATWEREFGEDDEFAELRQQKKREFVDNSWDNIKLASQLISRKLHRAYEKEKELDNMLRLAVSDAKSYEEKKNIAKNIASIKLEDINKLSITLGTLYDKQALASGEETERVKSTITIEDYLKGCEGERY